MAPPAPVAEDPAVCEDAFHHELRANFIAVRLILADADLIAESVCLAFAYEMRRG